MQIEVTIEHKTMAINFDPAELNSRIGQYMVASTQRKIKGGIKPDNAPLTVAVKQNTKTLRDRGLLMGSISYRADATQAVVGTNREGAVVQQMGFVIRAKKKWLWIPASSWTREQQRRFGFSASEVMKGLKSSRYAVWTVSRTPTSGVVLAKYGKKGKIHTVFVLKKSVVIPARPFLFLDELDHKVIGRMMKETVVPGGGGDA
jgi:phage gpG-like protein